jgi:predicted transcriptional regulator
MNSNENDPHLTAKIVSKYVAHHKLAASQLADLITTVHQAIGKLGTSPEPEEVRTPAVSVRRSVQHDYVICLDCGYQGKTLRRHINVQHGLSRDEYRQRWGLKSDHPLTAPAYSKQRSAMSKASGLGRKPSIEGTPVETVMPAPPPVEAEKKSEAKPAPRRRTRPAPKSEAVVSNPVAEPTPTRTRRSRRAAQPEKNTSPTIES